jgi:hypothetical protein
MGALMNVSLSMPVVAGWGLWLTTGLALVVWARRARAALLRAEAQHSAARSIPARPKSGVRLPKPPHAPADVFGELQALLDPPQSVSRRPGD